MFRQDAPLIVTTSNSNEVSGLFLSSFENQASGVRTGLFIHTPPVLFSKTFFANEPSVVVCLLPPLRSSLCADQVSSGCTGDAYLTDGQLVHNNVSMCLELNTFSLPPVDPSDKPSEDGLYTGNDTPNKECGSHKTNSFNVLPMHHLLSLQTNRSSQLRSRECSNSTTLSLHRRQCRCFVLMWCSAGTGNATKRNGTVFCFC